MAEVTWDGEVAADTGIAVLVVGVDVDLVVNFDGDGDVNLPPER